MSKTAFNVTGYILLAFVYEILHNGFDASGLNDRKLLTFLQNVSSIWMS